MKKFILILAAMFIAMNKAVKTGDRYVNQDLSITVSKIKQEGLAIDQSFLFPLFLSLY